MPMQGDTSGGLPPASVPDGELWRRGQSVDAPEDAAQRLLDLAGFADDRLDEDDRERVAEWLAGDAAAASDVAAARALAGGAEPTGDVSDAVLRRASALVGAEPAGNRVIAFPSGRRVRPPLPVVARWMALAAATVFAGWLGFALGMDTSLSLARRGQPGEDSFLGELLDPSTGFLRDLTEGART